MPVKLVRRLPQLFFGADDLKLPQQFSAVIPVKLLERLLDDRRARSALELDDRLPRCDQAEATLLVTRQIGQRQQQPRDSRVFQTSTLGMLRRMLQRFEPVEDQ